VTYVVPVCATLLGVLALNEPLSWHEPVGALIVLFGVACRRDWCCRSGAGVRPRPREQLLGGPRVDHPIRRTPHSAARPHPLSSQSS
jgi:hypothetical protein